MSELISGKEALFALENGEEVEYYMHKWLDVNRLSVRDLTSPDNMYKFRLKPKTITLNGIEVPVPFEPKGGEKCWIISDDYIGGYTSTTISGVSVAVWRNEDEIKQVIAALRSIFKTNATN